MQIMNKLAAIIAAMAMCMTTISSSVSAKTLLSTDGGDYNETLTEEIVTEEEISVEEAISAEEEAMPADEIMEETVPEDVVPEEAPQEEPAVPVQEETTIVEASNGTNTIRVIDNGYAKIPAALIFSKQYPIENNQIEAAPNSVVNLAIIPNYQYKIGNIKVKITGENGQNINGTYTTGSITLSSGQTYVDMFQFFMPFCSVTAELSYVEDSAVTILPSENGMLTYTMDYSDFGHPKVLFEAHPDEGYGTKSITVYDAVGTQLTKTNLSEDDTYIHRMVDTTYTAEAEFAPAFRVSGTADEHSHISFEIWGQKKDLAVEETPVKLVIETDQGYAVDILTATDGDGKVLDLGEDTSWLKMPAGDVAVTVTTKCVGLKYYDENGNELVCMDYTNVSEVREGMGYGLSNGWYVLDKDVTFNEHRMTITGDVNLILCDGATLNVAKGIRCGSDYNGGNNSLTIWGQQEQSGAIVCKDDIERNNAAIGGNNKESAGIINIRGGNVTAEGAPNGAGIGGGGSADGGSINIYGGKVIAIGGNAWNGAGAGIGGGNHGNGGYINIHGGEVTATGANWGAGIGGGNCGNGGSITISGGTVNAYGNKGGAGIGGGDDGNGGTIVILGGAITGASGGDKVDKGGAGIGGGDDGDGGEIIIKGGTVAAKGQYGGAGIGGGEKGSGGIISIYGGTIDARGGHYSFECVISAAGIGGGDHGNSGTINIVGGNITAKATYTTDYQSEGWGAGIGGGFGGSVNNVHIEGGNIESHGYRAVGKGEDGKDGTIVLGDNIQIDGVEYNKRYDVLSYAHDLLLISR